MPPKGTKRRMGKRKAATSTGAADVIIREAMPKLGDFVKYFLAEASRRIDKRDYLGALKSLRISTDLCLEAARDKERTPEEKKAILDHLE